MTPESLVRGTELTKLISLTKEQISRWENAASFKGTPECNFVNGQYSYVSAKYIPFDVVKILSIHGFKKELAELQEEFDSL